MTFKKGDKVRWRCASGFCDCEFIGRDGDEAAIITPGSGFRIVSVFDLEPLPAEPSGAKPTVQETFSKIRDIVGDAYEPESPRVGVTGVFTKLPRTVTCCDCGKPDMPIEEGTLCDGKWYCPTCTPYLDQTEDSVAGVAKSGWAPEAGKKCQMMGISGGPVTVFVRGVHKDRAWIAACIDPRDDDGLVVPLTQLSPIPSEPPVKLGEYIHVFCPTGAYYVGWVVRVEAEERHFLIQCVSGGVQYGFDWDQVEITKFVPSTLYDKMKTRLEIAIAAADKHRPIEADGYRELLDDLEDYAKEAKP